MHDFLQGLVRLLVDLYEGTIPGRHTDFSQCTWIMATKENTQYIDIPCFQIIRIPPGEGFCQNKPLAVYYRRNVENVSLEECFMFLRLHLYVNLSIVRFSMFMSNDCIYVK
jgi:hypothetical protein